MTASLARTSESKLNPLDDKTKTRMSYNVALKAAIHVTEKEFILIPIRELKSGEMFDYNCLESPGFLILILKGLPTAAATYAKLIGYYNGSSDIEIGANLQFETPTNLLIASGDLLINVRQLKTRRSKVNKRAATTNVHDLIKRMKKHPYTTRKQVSAVTLLYTTLKAVYILQGLKQIWQLERWISQLFFELQNPPGGLPLWVLNIYCNVLSTWST